MTSNLKDFIEHEKFGTITNYTILGNCSRCGNCCSDFLHLDDKEIEVIDNYLKKHKVKQRNKGRNIAICPFRNEEEKKCEIYEVRPLICRVFKCDKKPEDAVKERDLINGNRKVRSMAELFFKDESKIKFMKKNLGLKVYKRGK